MTTSPGARFLGRDALGDLYQERRGRASVLVRRLSLPPAVAKELIDSVTAAAEITHPNLLGPIEVGGQDGKVQVVSELVEGRTLRDLLTALAAGNEKLAASRGTYIAIEVLGAVVAAHAHKDAAGTRAPVIHGRISPEHIVLTPRGEVRLAGFGLDPAARYLLPSHAKVDPAFAYIAPEQCAGKPPTPAADVFAVACVLAESLLGTPLFLESTYPETIRRISNDPAPSVQSKRGEVPLALEQLLIWCLNKSPDGRCPRAEVMLQRMCAFQGMLEVGDRIKPREHGPGLADLLRLRLRSGPEGLGLGLTVPQEVTTAEPMPDEEFAPVVTRTVARPRPRPSALRRLLGAGAAVALVLGAGAATWRFMPAARRLAGPYVPTPIAWRLDRLMRVETPAAPHADAPPAPSAPPPAAVVGTAASRQPTPAPETRAETAPPPKPAALAIRTSRPGVVFLDGKKLGASPVKSASVAPGEHVIEVVLRGAKRRTSQRVTLSPGETKTVTVAVRRK